MQRTSSAALADLAKDAVAAALKGIAITYEPATNPTADLIVRVDDREVLIDIKATAYATPERVHALVRHSPPGSAIRLLVADHITEAARQELSAAGWSWLDRRGHLYLRAAGVIIDRDVEPLARPSVTAPAQPIAGRAGIAVAYLLLLAPNEPQPVRASAPGLGFSPASISTVRTALRAAGLLERNDLPVVPELFWALADVWHSERTWLANEPKPGDTHTNVRDLEGSGWCLTGTAAAAEWGAPVVAPHPVVDLFVPGPVIITIARREYGTARNAPADAAASIAVAPASAITSHRLPPRRHAGWPLAHPLAVALDLAQDRGRGREILADWTPPPRFHRVW